VAEETEDAPIDAAQGADDTAFLRFSPVFTN